MKSGGGQSPPGAYADRGDGPAGGRQSGRRRSGGIIFGGQRRNVVAKGSWSGGRRRSAEAQRLAGSAAAGRREQMRWKAAHKCFEYAGNVRSRFGPEPAVGWTAPSRERDSSPC